MSSYQPPLDAPLPSGRGEASGSGLVTLRRYLGVVRRQWWVIAVVLVMSLAAATAYVELKTPVHAASMKLVVGQRRALFGPTVPGVQPATQSMSDLLQSHVVAGRVIRQLGLATSPKELLDHLDVTSTPDTSVIQLTYEDTDRDRATLVLQKIGTVFTTLADNRLARAAGSASNHPLATVFDPAHSVPGVVSPRPALILPVAGILGLFMGLVLAFVRDAAMNRIRNNDEARQAFGASVIGALPSGALGTSPAELGASPRLSGRLTESMQRLSATVRFSGSQLDSGVIVVTSAVPEEGKTTVASHLASTLAAGGETVVVVDADFRKPMLSRFFELSLGERGITDAAAGDVPLTQALVEYHVDRNTAGMSDSVFSAERDWGLSDSEQGDQITNDAGRLLVLPAGRQQLGLPGAISLGTSAELVAQLRELAGYVVIDTPPLLVTGDAFPLIQLADSVLVVCREGLTSRDDARHVREVMTSLRIREFSIVLTESKTAERRGYYEYRRPAVRSAGTSTRDRA